MQALELRNMDYGGKPPVLMGVGHYDAKSATDDFCAWPGSVWFSFNPRFGTKNNSIWSGSFHTDIKSAKKFQKILKMAVDGKYLPLKHTQVRLRNINNLGRHQPVIFGASINDPCSRRSDDVSNGWVRLHFGVGFLVGAFWTPVADAGLLLAELDKALAAFSLAAK